MRALAVMFVFVAVGCGGSDECSSDEIEVAYLGGPRDGETVCAPIPAACGASATCGAQACIAEMYGLCESPYLGVACSDTFPPVIISCND